MGILEGLFSIKNTNDKRHKIINVLGIKVKTKSKNYYKLGTQKVFNLTYLTDLYAYYNKDGYVCSDNTDKMNSVTIVIPIYNGIEHLKKLIPNLLKYTPKSAKIIILNDCSPDPEINIYLNENCNCENVTIINNEKNLGFVKTVNKGMTLVNTKYAVWLNSDVIVPEFWLERILEPFNNYDKIATTTPFTNSGVTFSFPVFGKDNKLTEDVEVIDKYFQHIYSYDNSLNETYSGTGFCMAINMDCWAEIGNLDEECFGKGYGEENDWCFRALRKGWKHYLIPNLFVQHNHGGSFDSKEKKKLCEEHYEILEEKYPEEIKTIVPKFMKNDPWKKYRQLACILSSRKNTLLLIDLKPVNSDKSGAIDYRKKLVEKLSLEHDVWILQYERCKNNIWSLTCDIFSTEMEIKLRTFADIKLFFDLIPIKKVVINNFAFLYDVENTINILCKLKNMYGFEMSYKFHDYLSICPSFFLLNKESMSCSSYGDKTKCSTCLVNNKFKTIKREDIETWRGAFNKLFNCVDEFNFFSEYTLNIVKKVYPIVTKNYSIKEHESLFSENYSRYKRSEIINKQITIAFVGNFCKEKGSKYFINLAKLCKSRGLNYKFIIIGQNNNKDKYNGIQYIGEYNRDSLGKILTKNNVNAVVYSSINNETFSYLAQELMILNVPFICFNNGAHSERIKKYKYEYAEISEEISEEGLYKALTKLLDKVYSVKITQG